MSSNHWLAVAAWAFLPLAASAQQTQDPDPADPSAHVSSVRYESAFKTFRSSQEDGPAPDKGWRSANEEMGRLGGHVGHMKEGAPQPDASPPADTPALKQGATEHSKHH